MSEDHDRPAHSVDANGAASQASRMGAMRDRFRWLIAVIATGLILAPVAVWNGATAVYEIASGGDYEPAHSSAWVFGWSATAAMLAIAAYLLLGRDLARALRRRALTPLGLAVGAIATGFGVLSFIIIYVETAN